MSGEELRAAVKAFIEDHDDGRLGPTTPLWCDGKCAPLDRVRAALRAAPSTPEPSGLRAAVDGVFDSLLAAVIAEMKVVGDSYPEEGMVANRAVAQAFRYYASSWLADQIKQAHEEVRDALMAAPSTEPALDVERLREAINAAMTDDDVPIAERPRPAQVAAEYARLAESQS